MSLNGLENPTVVEAYQTALTEAGGWFLLRYVSRDEVALLERGTGGVPDVRNAIEGYEECSPLYGFLQYRRRKVVLSYMPEDLSRLVRARTTVQFQSILDKFSPHDTVFSLTRPSDLSESALSSACLLHTASGSITSSSSSLRRRRLMEIAEDAEENSPDKNAVQTQGPSQDFRQRSFSQLSEATVVAPSVISNTTQTPNGNESAPMSSDIIQTNGHTPSISGDHASERPTSSRNFRDDLSYAPSEPRKSTQSARPSLRDLEHAAGYKPKVKLGPRPSVDGSGRPRTAGNISRTAEQRPVASLPAGVRSSSLRKSNPTPTRPRSQGNPVATTTPNKSVPPVPPLLVPPLSMPISRPQLSPGAKSLSALSTSGTSHEKERLMKALQMRRSQMQKRAQEVKATQISTDEKRQAIGDLDDKENIAQTGDKPRNDTNTVSEETKGRLSETPPPASLETNQTYESAQNSSSGSLKVDALVHIVTNDQSGSKPPDTLFAKSATPECAILDKALAKVQVALEIEPPPEPETVAIQEDLAVSDESKIKCGTISPSPAVDVPPEIHLQKAPEEEIIITPSPQEEKPPALHEEEIVPTPESAEITKPQAVPLPKSPVSDSPNSVTEAPTATAPRRGPTPDFVDVEQESTTTRKDKRKPFLEPIQVPTPEYSDDDNLLSDDSFMEELKSATVEEAKPISVGKSPLSPGYSNTGSNMATPDAWRNSRAVSNPSAIGRQYPSTSTLAVNRSFSSSFMPIENPTGPVLVAKKINVSSGISKRIKALEKFSNSRDGTSSPIQSVHTPSSSSFETLRKRASVSLGTGNPDVISLSRHASYAPEPFSRASSLKRQNSQASTSATRTVTTHIVREPNAKASEPNDDPTGSHTLNLQASNLTVDHGSSDVSQTPQTLTADSVPSKSEKRSMSTSSAGSAPQPFPAVLPRSESRLSLSSASRHDGVNLPRSPSDVSVSSPDEKKESRTSRILRRMSSITSGPRRGTNSSRSPAVKEEAMPSLDEGSRGVIELPEAVDIGEVNVQFPDTLLWKRRFIRIDSKGYLVLTPGNIDSSNRSMIKRYHLTEFKTPCLPDEERQELPNSILLDFLDGRTLQCACESRQGQAFVLQTLVHAHQLLSK